MSRAQSATYVAPISAHDGVSLTLSSDGHIADAAATALGWDTGALRGLPYWELAHPECQDAVVSAFDPLLSGATDAATGRIALLGRDGWYRAAGFVAERAGARRVTLQTTTPMVAVDADHGPRLVATWRWRRDGNEVTASEELSAMLDLRTQTMLDPAEVMSRVSDVDAVRLRRQLELALHGAEPPAATIRSRTAVGRFIRVVGRIDRDGAAISGATGVAFDASGLAGLVPPMKS